MNPICIFLLNRIVLNWIWKKQLRCHEQRHKKQLEEITPIIIIIIVDNTNIHQSKENLDNLITFINNFTTSTTYKEKRNNIIILLRICQSIINYWNLDSVNKKELASNLLNNDVVEIISVVQEYLFVKEFLKMNSYCWLHQKWMVIIQICLKIIFV